MVEMPHTWEPMEVKMHLGVTGGGGAMDNDTIGQHINYEDASEREYATNRTFETERGRPRALYRLLSGSRNISSLQPVSFNHPAAP